jgi:hypothetical protein
MNHDILKGADHDREKKEVIEALEMLCAALKGSDNSYSKDDSVVNSKQLKQEVERSLRIAVTDAYKAGYEACENGGKYDGGGEVVANIIGDAIISIGGAISKGFKFIGDKINDIDGWLDDHDPNKLWDDMRKRLDELFDWTPW